MTEYPYTSADLAKEFGISKKTLRAKAAPLRIGIDFGGRKGFLYSEADRRALIESLRPEPPAPRKRRNTRRAA